MGAEKLLQRKILQNIQEWKMDNYYLISWISEIFSKNDGLLGHGQQPHGRRYRRSRGCCRGEPQEVKMSDFPFHGERGSPPPAGCFYSYPKCFAFLSHGRRYRRCCCCGKPEEVIAFSKSCNESLCFWAEGFFCMHELKFILQSRSGYAMITMPNKS